MDSDIVGTHAKLDSSRSVTITHRLFTVKQSHTYFTDHLYVFLIVQLSILEDFSSFETISFLTKTQLWHIVRKTFCSQSTYVYIFFCSLFLSETTLIQEGITSSAWPVWPKMSWLKFQTSSYTTWEPEASNQAWHLLLTLPNHWHHCLTLQSHYRRRSEGDHGGALARVLCFPHLVEY